ncbi:putative protein-serine/threonine phosphatase [Helianthus anomalus]
MFSRITYNRRKKKESMAEPNRNPNVITKEHVSNLPCTVLTGTNHNNSTTKSKSSVKKHIASVPRSLLPPLISPNKKTVFLDLDKTLIHSIPASRLIGPRNYDFVAKPLLGCKGDERYVLKRPYVDEFLRFLSESDFEIVVFTAGNEEYASTVLDMLDRDGLISHRLYRDSCKEINGRCVKDLSCLGRDLKKGVIVDDKPKSYSLQPENGIPISPFTDDLGDEELKKLMSGFFTKCHEFEDLRDAVKHYFGN